jgi:hypothetical protein
MLSILGADALPAPMLQRLTPNGSLETPPVIFDPFHEFPLCSVDLYREMGVEACSSKYPLFRCGRSTSIREGGNHFLPDGIVPPLSPLQGVTHHFKWRRPVLERLAARIDSAHPWRHESIGYQDYLQNNGNLLPVNHSFVYARAELFRRGLLRRATLAESVSCILKNFLDGLPVGLQRPIRASFNGLRRAINKVGRRSHTGASFSR